MSKVKISEIELKIIANFEGRIKSLRKVRDALEWNVKANVSEMEMEKRFRKRQLQVHPDKWVREMQEMAGELRFTDQNIFQ